MRVYVWNVSVYLDARIRVCMFVCVRERNIWGARDGNNLARKVPRKKERGDLSAIAESMKIHQRKSVCVIMHKFSIEPISPDARIRAV